MQQAFTSEMFINEQQFERFIASMQALDLRAARPLEEQPFPRHFDLVYRDKCIIHFDYIGQTLDFHVRALIQDGRLVMNPRGDFSVCTLELRKRISRAVISN